MKKLTQGFRSNIVAWILIRLLKKRFPKSPYTCIITRWDDGDFMVEVRTTLFDLPQHIALQDPHHIEYLKMYRYLKGKLTFIEKTIRP